MKKAIEFIIGLIIGIILFNLLIGCASMRQNQYLKNNDTQYSYQIGTGKITPGMSKKEVRASWGGPSSISDYGFKTYWHYYGMTVDYMLVFKNGKLKNWSKHY